MIAHRRIAPHPTLCTWSAAVCALVAAEVPAFAQCTLGHGGSIEIVADAVGTTSEATFDIGVPRDVFIVARPEGPVAAGMIHAEFGVAGLPAGWSATLTPNPDITVALGDPFAEPPNRRAVLAFGSCAQPDAAGVVLLYTVTITATSHVENARLRVVAADFPATPCLTTPMLCPCECALTLYRYEAAGGEFCINPEGRCQVTVEAATWSRVRELFR